MDALALIEAYRNDHAGKSSFIDQVMTTTGRALQDACRMAEKSEFDFAQANLFIARNQMTRLLESLPNPDSIRKPIIAIYSAIEDELCENQEGEKP